MASGPHDIVSSADGSAAGCPGTPGATDAAKVPQWRIDVQQPTEADLAAAEDPEALKADILARLEAVRSPFRTAERFVAEEIIDPRDTRPLLCEWADLAARLRTAGPVGFPMRP